ncbi:hypothetical protein D9611_009702 [Ephemerocybe angulata]|uniref:P-loop containing nucleoside triphosphate hydrolase protein n=1 Tax=Ephemerocybe angulata TaxID=980116 RepID=A0A8H5C852_9AGAR|nr:hypothetical protein D9611_009702 [Tulosesus angulatus]
MINSVLTSISLPKRTMPTVHRPPSPSPPSPISSRQRRPDGIIGVNGDDGQHLPSKRDNHLVDSEYSRKAKLLIALANDLTRLGGAQFDLDIPCLAFIGNQSAGKSSVVEAATGIGVPRESGTCTRCPMQCTMIRSSGAWSCRITLQFSYDSKGQDRVPPVAKFFCELSNPKDVEIWLKRAQAAILSPDADPDDFRDLTVDDLKALKTLPFSLNTIELLVRDPEGTDLCFVDLPGIIQHHTKDATLVPFIKNLVERHIKRKNTIIVVTIPMTDDIENQEAFRIAHRVDRKGLRTIGVGTKPDLLNPGSLSALDLWRGILEGPSSNLKHGYYCVKMPDDRTRKLGLSRVELAKQEEEFFATRDPWKSIDDKSRLGMKNFVDNMSKLLITLIEKNIPTIKRTVIQLLDKNLQEFEQLPPKPKVESPLPWITIRIIRFCKVLQGTIHGTINKKFIHQSQACYETFKAEITSTTPQLVAQHHNPAVNVLVGQITVEIVRDVIKSHMTWELPGYVHFDATKDLILRHVQHWKKPMIDCFEAICKATLALMTGLIKDEEHFGRFGELQNFVRGIVEEQRLRFQTETSTMLNKIFDLENSAPIYTANSAAYTSARTSWLNIVYQNQNPQLHSDAHKVMADVHAYFQVAHMRFIDYVILSLEGEWHQKLVASLEERLIEAVSLAPKERLIYLLSEDKLIAAKREDLTQKVDQLTKIKERLVEYEKEASLTYNDDDE